MFKNVYPLFERKRLLKKEMLENIRDFPRDIVDIFFQDYSDGILAGCDIKVKESYLFIGAGILYRKGIPYVMNEPYKLPYQATGKTQYIKVRFLDEIEGTEQKEGLTQIYINDIPAQDKDELELGRFKLQEGARLRDQYTDFFDYATEFDTLIKLYAPYASPKQSTLCPEIIKRYAESLMYYNLQNPWDYAFCFTCMQEEGAITYSAIKSYLDVRLQQKQENYSTKEIYDALAQLLREAGGKAKEPCPMAEKNKKVLLF